MSVVRPATVTIKCDVPGCEMAWRDIPEPDIAKHREFLILRQDWSSNGTHDWCGWHDRTAPHNDPSPAFVDVFKTGGVITVTQDFLDGAVEAQRLEAERLAHPDTP